MGFGLVTGFIEHLYIVTTSNCSAIANSHTQQFTRARTNFSVCCVFTGYLAFSAVASSASVFHRFTSSLAVAHVTNNSAFLRNDLLHWGLLRQGRLSEATSDGCLPTTNCRLTILDISRLTGMCFDSPDIASAWTQQKTPLTSIPLLSRDVSADADVTCRVVTCSVPLSAV
jgi:hypothetical protein